MDSFHIRKYKPEDHDEVIRIYRSQFDNAIKIGIIDGMKTKKVYCSLLFIFFMCSSLSSLYYGIISLFIGICVHGLSVWLCYRLYEW